MWLLRSLIFVEELSVDEGEEDVGAHEEEDLPIDQLVEGPLPFEQQAGETAGGGAGHVPLVGNGHFRSLFGEKSKRNNKK